MPGAGRHRAAIELLAVCGTWGRNGWRRTMTVLPLYWTMWQDRPTSFPPPRQRNMSSSEGSTGSSLTVAAMAEALRLEAMLLVASRGLPGVARRFLMNQ